MFVPQFYPILDTEIAARHGLDAFAAAEQIIDAGARILQFRHKANFDREVLYKIEQIAALCSRFGTIFVMNDRADLARIFGAALHLGQDDLSPGDARIVTGSDTRIGYSTHNEAQLKAAASESVDYVALGPIFGTTSKQNPDPVVGLDGLRRLRSLTNRPLVAIGGITRENARSVIESGADSVAVIGDLFPDVKTRTAEFITKLSS
jgi:thiamine-phosphate pyrophosphorylase